jgi:hypothetical protein
MLQRANVPLASAAWSRRISGAWVMERFRWFPVYRWVELVVHRLTTE